MTLMKVKQINTITKKKTRVTGKKEGKMISIKKENIQMKG